MADPVLWHSAPSAVVSGGGRHLAGLLSSSNSNWCVAPPERCSLCPGSKCSVCANAVVDLASSCLLTSLLLLLCLRPRFLILIVVVVSVGAVIGNVYIIAFYQHPEARERKAKWGRPALTRTPSPNAPT